MGFSQADLDRINRAIASGALVVSYDDGRSVRYRDLDELLTARSIIDRALNGGAPLRKVMAHDKGIEAGLAGEGPWPECWTD